MHNYDFTVIERDCEKLAERVDFSQLRNKTVFIVGANGLIGGFLSDFFCYLNNHFSYNIKIILSSYSQREKAVRVKHLLRQPNVKYFSWDCAQSFSEAGSRILENRPLDYVFFCAGYGQPAKFLKDAVKTVMINVVGPESILSYLHQNGGGSFLFLSSSEIYGSPSEQNVPTSEDYSGNSSLENNRACYIESKRTAEVLCRLYNKHDKMNIKSARVALTYGPGVLRSDKRVMQSFIFKAHESGEIQMLDDGASIRNYLYITDCAEILLNIILRGKHDVYNVGGDTEEISIFGLAKGVASIFNDEVSVKKGTSSHSSVQAAPRKVGLSMKRYREEFSSHGENIVNLKEGLTNVVKWFKIV